MCSRLASPRSLSQDPGRVSVAADCRPLQEDVGPPASSAPGSRRPHSGLNPHRVKASKLPALLWTRRSARLKTRPPLRGPHGSPPHGPRTWGPRTSVPPSGPLRNSILFPSLPDFSPTKLPTPSAAAETRGPVLTCAQRPEEGDWRCRSARRQPELQGLLRGRGGGGAGRSFRVLGPPPGPGQAPLHLPSSSSPSSGVGAGRFGNRSGGLGSSLAIPPGPTWKKWGRGDVF